MNIIAGRFSGSSGTLVTRRMQTFAGSLGTHVSVTTSRTPTNFETFRTQRAYATMSAFRQHQQSILTASELTNSFSSLSLARGFSSKSMSPTAESDNESSDAKIADTTISEEGEREHLLSQTSSTMFTDNESGEQYGIILDTRKLPKLKPSIVKKRLAKLKIYEGRERSIRQSPWKLNRICQLAAGLTLEEGLTQLQFCDKKNADLVAKVLKRTSNLADIRDGLQISQLEIAECFATRSLMLKRIKPMGRGRHGIMHHKFSHIRVVLREIDFPLKIYQAQSLNQKKKWMLHQQRAENDAKAARVQREELERLEQQQAAQLAERKAAASKQ